MGLTVVALYRDAPNTHSSTPPTTPRFGIASSRRNMREITEELAVAENYPSAV